MLSTNAELVITIPSHQLHVRADIQRVPLMVLTLDIYKQPTIPFLWKRRAFSQLWWQMLARLVGHARLGYASLPPVPIPECAVPIAPFRLDSHAALTLNWLHTIDARYNRLLDGITVAWLDDGSIPCPTVECSSIELEGNSIEISTVELKGYLAVISQQPISVVCRWVFIPRAVIDTLLRGTIQGVLSLQTLDMRIVFLMRYDRDLQDIISSVAINAPQIVTDHLPPFDQIWWEVHSLMAGFPQKSENNEQKPQPLDPPITIAQDIIPTCDFRRELFLDGPGWLLSGATALHSIVLDMLDQRDHLIENLTILLDGQPLMEGRDFSIATIDAFSNLQHNDPADICLRMITIPSRVFVQ